MSETRSWWDEVTHANEAGDGFVLVSDDGWSAAVCLNVIDGEPDGTWGYTIFNADNSTVYASGGGYYDFVTFDSAEEAMDAAEVYLLEHMGED